MHYPKRFERQTPWDSKLVHHSLTKYLYKILSIHKGSHLIRNKFFFLAVCECPGQGLNPCQSSTPGHSSDNARSFTHCTTRERIETTFKYTIDIPPLEYIQAHVHCKYSHPECFLQSSSSKCHVVTAPPCSTQKPRPGNLGQRQSPPSPVPAGFRRPTNSGSERSFAIKSTEKQQLCLPL